MNFGGWHLNLCSGNLTKFLRNYGHHLNFLIAVDKVAKKIQKRQRLDKDMDTSSSTISASAIQGIVDKLKYQGRRNSTRKNYYTVWKLFNQFFIRLDYKPETWEDRIILFVGYLIENEKKSTTVKSYVSAIKAVLKDDNVSVNEDRYLLTLLTKACKYQNDTVHTRLPITSGLLDVILNKIQILFQDHQPYLAIMYKALISTAYFGMFRVGELTLSQHVVKARDVKVADNKEKLMFILRTSKTHWKDEKPQIISISAEKVMGDNTIRFSHKPQHCPFQLLRDYVHVRRTRKQPMEQFFIFKNRALVKPEHMHDILRKALNLAGLDLQLYGCHSTHVGRALDLFHKYKLSVSSIKNLGRWKSNVVYSYLKH